MPLLFEHNVWAQGFHPHKQPKKHTQETQVVPIGQDVQAIMVVCAVSSCPCLELGPAEPTPPARPASGRTTARPRREETGGTKKKPPKPRLDNDTKVSVEDINDTTPQQKRQDNHQRRSWPTTSTTGLKCVPMSLVLPRRRVAAQDMRMDKSLFKQGAAFALEPQGVPWHALEIYDEPASQSHRKISPSPNPPKPILILTPTPQTTRPNTTNHKPPNPPPTPPQSPPQSPPNPNPTQTPPPPRPSFSAPTPPFRLPLEGGAQQRPAPAQLLEHRRGHLQRSQQLSQPNGPTVSAGSGSNKVVGCLKT